MPYIALGADAYLEISTWHRPEEVLAESHLVILTRPGFKADLMEPLSSELREMYELKGQVHEHEKGSTIRAMGVTAMDISSTMIRELIRKKQSIRYLVPETVSRYIRQNDPYG
jgi:nicotinate-nucleotide adenylyltransferase